MKPEKSARPGVFILPGILGSAQTGRGNGRLGLLAGITNLNPIVVVSFELVKCNVFVSECTFGLPVYHWEKEESVHQQINQWWSNNAKASKPSLLFAYSLGKAQRVLRGLDSEIGPIFAHGAVHPFLPVYESSGVKFPRVQKPKDGDGNWSGAMIVAPLRWRMPLDETL